LEEELLEVEDGDERREPVVREGDGGEAGAEGKGDGHCSEFLCGTQEGSAVNCPGGRTRLTLEKK
jgi:hypothetical protein